MAFRQDLAQGIENLLVNCAGLKAGERALIICEDPALGWYDAAAPAAVAKAAGQMGVACTTMAAGAPQNGPLADVEEAIGAHDCTIYFSRMGDQVRFDRAPPGRRSVMCYIRNEQMLASAYGRAPYGAMRALKNALDDVLVQARHIEITCPLGTRFAGEVNPGAARRKADVSVLRFPLGVHLPLCASQFSGRVALTRYLTPTGSKCYQPASIALEKTSFAEVENGRIVRFTGDHHEVRRIEHHYAMVADQFGLDRNTVHSWHAGFHPCAGYRARACDDPDRWSNSVFTNPRVVHFHTCGDYAPAEISWMVMDQTICVDGVNLWQDGRLVPRAMAGTRACLEQWPWLQQLFAAPDRDIGLDDSTA